MGFDENDELKEFAASTRKIVNAKKQGIVLRSGDLSAAISLIVCVLLIVMFVPTLYSLIKNIIFLCWSFSIVTTELDVVSLFTTAIQETLKVIAPLLVLLSIVSIVCIIAIGGWNFSLEVIKPSFRHLSISAGCKRIFSISSLYEALKLLLSYCALLVIGIYLFYSFGSQYLLLAKTDFTENVSFFGCTIIVYALCLAVMILLIGLVDLVFKTHQYYAKLRMSIQEIRDEARDSGIDPRIKRKTRQRKKNISMK